MVAYDSSLEYLDENVVRPAFEAATGAGYSGTGNTSGALAGDITAAEISPDVFESIGGGDITPLVPKFTTWYIQYASTSVVVAYNPKSKYAPRFKAIADGRKPVKDLFTLLETRGLRLGRTDPGTDPQARDFIMMLELAQSRYRLPRGTVARILGTSDYASPDSGQIYAGSALEATLQAGQLDAASAFASQAVQMRLDYIKLPAAISLGRPADAAQYRKASITVGGKIYRGSPLVVDITTIGAPAPAAETFVAYTLSPAGLAQYRRAGFTVIKPTVFGDRSAVPAPVLSELGR
ncbi:MAG: substrate-binding domain-containing protein [Trebonia sp.]